MKIYCPIRKKFVKKTPEEVVRQYIIKYLLLKGFNKCLFRVEKQIITYSNINFRPDIVIYDKFYNPYIIVECKAENIKISYDCIEQISKYNSFLKSKYLIVTNGELIFTWIYDDEKYKKININEITLL